VKFLTGRCFSYNSSPFHLKSSEDSNKMSSSTEEPVSPIDKGTIFMSQEILQNATARVKFITEPCELLTFIPIGQQSQALPFVYTVQSQLEKTRQIFNIQLKSGVPDNTLLESELGLCRKYLEDCKLMTPFGKKQLRNMLLCFQQQMAIFHAPEKRPTMQAIDNLWFLHSSDLRLLLDVLSMVCLRSTVDTRWFDWFDDYFMVGEMLDEFATYRKDYVQKQWNLFHHYYRSHSHLSYRQDLKNQFIEFFNKMESIERKLLLVDRKKLDLDRLNEFRNKLKVATESIPNPMGKPVVPDGIDLSQFRDL